MTKGSLRTFQKKLRKSHHIVIVTHWNPDGDAVGSSLGLWHYLKNNGKKPCVIVPNSFPEFLDFLPGSKNILNYQQNESRAQKVLTNADLIFTLDFNSFKRLDQMGPFLEKTSAPKVLIDHHPTPDDYAEFSFHDAKACSTSELIFKLIRDLKGLKYLDKKTACCIYTGIMTDTGSFRYPCVNAETHRIVAELVKSGITPADIHSAVYDSYSYNRLRLIGYAISQKLKIIPGLPVAYITIAKKELEEYKYEKGDLEGLVNYPLSIKGIKVSALLNETDNHVKLSFRSKGASDVNLFARKHFKGGGHMNAAGGKSLRSLSETEKKFVETISKIF
jgi:phosphoesterase RecJ-like protein